MRLAFSLRLKIRASLLHPPRFWEGRVFDAERSKLGSNFGAPVLHPPNFGRVEVLTRSSQILGEGLPSRPSRVSPLPSLICCRFTERQQRTAGRVRCAWHFHCASNFGAPLLHPPNFGRVEVLTRNSQILGEGLPSRPARASPDPTLAHLLPLL